jgi:hypothetical protein
MTRSFHIEIVVARVKGDFALAPMAANELCNLSEGFYVRFPSYRQEQGLDAVAVDAGSEKGIAADPAEIERCHFILQFGDFLNKLAH